MDHLPSIKNTLHPYPQVPYLGIVEDRHIGYDNSFDSFPKKYGYSLKQLKKGQYDGKSLDDLAPMLQAWLFFGLLTEIIEAADLKFSASDFISSGEGERERIVTTEKLRDLILQWHCQEWAADDYKAEVNLKHVMDCLKTTRAVTDAVVKHFNDEAFFVDPETGEDLLLAEKPPTGHLVLMSIILLGEALDQAKKYVYSEKGEKVRDLNELAGDRNNVLVILAQITEIWKLPFYVRLLLLHGGWCEYEIDTLDKTIDESRISVLYYLSFLDRHQMLPLGKGHSDCSREACIVNNVDRKMYKTRHTDECNGAPGTCEFIHLEESEKEFLEIIRSSGVPLVQVSCQGNSTQLILSRAHSDKNPLKQAGYLSQKAISSAFHFLPTHRPSVAEPTALYVALSHVWAHGLGNPHSNSLPACQLRRLQEMVDNMYSNSTKHTPFWIDTLCIPIPRSYTLTMERLSRGAASEEEQKVEDDAVRADASKPVRPKNPVRGDRNDAIAAMAKIYRNADRVLVIDRSIELCPTNASPEQCLVAIKCSTWVQRLWTYQEGFLTKNCWFRFADRALQIEHLITAYKKKKDDQLEHFHKMYKEKARGGSMWHRRCEKVLDQRRSGMSLSEFGIEASNIRVMGMDLSPSLISDVVRGDQLLCRHIAKGLVDPVFRTAAKFAKDLQYKPPNISEHRVEVLIPILAALGWRQTTTDRDEPVCIGSMMGLDVAKILKHNTTEERMVELLNQLRFAPKSIFFSSLPSLAIPGYGWAPKSYLNSKPEATVLQAFREEKLCKISPVGLRFRSPGLAVTLGSRPPMDGIMYVDAGSGRRLEVSFRGSCRDGTDHSWAHYRNQKLYFLLRYPLNFRFDDDAALILFTDREAGVLCGNYEAALSVTLLKKKEKIVAEEGVVGVVKEVKNSGPEDNSYGYNRDAEEPLWCIG